MKLIDVVLPAHNEAASIAQTLDEFHRVVMVEGGIPIRFLVCEDGSTDATADVVRSLSERLPILLLSAPGRKGYSRAVVDGLRAAESDLVAFIDSDGQCDPADFAKLLAALPGHHLVLGCRSPRHDPLLRIVMSHAFKLVYARLFPVPVGDPSCPYLVITRAALRTVLAGNPGILKQGFWWEFLARVTAADLSLVEVPVRHRPRTAGSTVVYLPTKIPGIAWHHLLALFELRREVRGVGRPIATGATWAGDPATSRA